jgi:peptide/nickel transport system permease protein
LVVVAASTLVGGGLALLSAWLGGWFDQLVSRSVDTLFAFPGLLLAIFAVAILGPGLVAPVGALAIAYTPYIARITRSAALRERSLSYVEACRVEGMTGRRISLRHILPNLAPLIGAQASVAFGYAMIDLAAISFLGLGIQPPTPDWGSMVAAGESGILQGSPEESLSAGIMIVIAVVVVNVLGDRISGYRTSAR